MLQSIPVGLTWQSDDVRRVATRFYHDALVAARAERYSEAITLTQRALAAGGPDAGLLGLLGLLYRQAGRVGEALAAWRDASGLLDAPRWASALRSEPSFGVETEALRAYNQGIELALADRWAEALVALKPATGESSRLGLAFVLQGLAAWVQGDRTLSESSWRGAMELDPSTPGLTPCMTALVDYYWERLTKQTAESGPAGDPGEMPVARWAAAILLGLLVGASGTAWYHSGQSKAAQTAAQEASQRAAAAEAALAETQGALAASEAARAEAEAEAVRAQAALEAAKAAADAKPGEAVPPTSEAQARDEAMTRLLSAAEELETAEQVQALMAAIERAESAGVVIPAWITRTLPEARTRAAVARYFEGYEAFMADRYDQAVPAFTQSLSLDAKVYTADDAAYLAAKSLELAGKAAEALPWYERVIAEFPNSPYVDDATYFAGKTAEDAGQKHKAVGYYEKMLSTYPGSGYDWLSEDGLKRLR